MTTPYRVQLKRTKGWRMPPNTVKVDRSTRWGNRCLVGTEWHTLGDPARSIKIRDVQHSLEVYEEQAKLNIGRFTELKGKNLACWCKIGAPCHADILLKWVNQT